MEEGTSSRELEEEDHLDDVGEDGAEEETEVDDEEDEEEEYAFRFANGMDPLDFVNEDASGLQPYELFERLEYEALADKKRKALANSQKDGEGSNKKPRLDDISGATMEEIMEAMNYGVRRKPRKQRRRGRRKGTRNKLNPEISRMLGDATLHYAHGRYEEAINVLKEVVRLAPNLPDSYHTLGLIYTALGNDKKAKDFYMIAARLAPKDSALWKLLYTWSIKQGNSGQAKYCLSKAITADPDDLSLRFQLASLYLEAGDHQRAAEAYDQIQKVCPPNVEALKTGAKLYLKCGQHECAVSILEEYVKNYSLGADSSVIDLLAAIYMENNAHDKALKLIQHENLEKDLPSNLIVKEGICHLHLGNMEKAESLFSVLQQENKSFKANLITEVADSYLSIDDYDSALKYYLMLEGNGEANARDLCSTIPSYTNSLKAGQCYLHVKRRTEAILTFYKGLQVFEDNVVARITLASLLLEENKDEEAISLLSPPNNFVTKETDLKPWWEHEKVKLMLGKVYREKGMIEEFVDVICPLVRESLFIEAVRKKRSKKRRAISSSKKKKLTKTELQKRLEVLHDQQPDNIFSGFRPVVRTSALLKANRAKRLLQKREELKEEKRAAFMMSGIDWESDGSEDEQQENLEPEKSRVPPLHLVWKDEECRSLIIYLCKALASLRRYWESLEIINLTLRLAEKELPSEMQNELSSLGAKAACDTTDPKHAVVLVKQFVQRHPYSLAAWNCYYKVIFGLNEWPKYSKSLRLHRSKYTDTVPPILISGHQFNRINHYQDATREYLEAYKHWPHSPLISLCAGTSLLNLAQGHRLQSKQQCITQGLAFLYNNLKLTDNSQEAMYNIGRAFHHVGLITLAASYYEKVLSTPRVKDYPIPKLLNESAVVPTVEEEEAMKKPGGGYCDLRREAAFNLHLIYKKSGAHDLARQVLKEHCSF